MNAAKHRLRRVALIALAGLVIAPAAQGKRPERTARVPPAAARADRPADESRRVRVEYGDLVDRSAMTHGGKTVGSVLDAAGKAGGRLPASASADLQPFLEPFSFACGEVAEAARPAGGAPLAGIADDYPPGSRQPAWAALFREGRYQLFAGGGRARLFLPGDRGESPAELFRRHAGVVRHPLRKALEKAGGRRLALEVYAFRNDYASRSLSLDLTPWVTTITPRDCRPALRAIPLEGLSDFFAAGPTLEAAEIDADGNLFLYGSGPGGETLAGRTAALEDFAVVYRSVFHHGRNPPYVSLDADADSRHARVNFGGLLADTRVGAVLLESDRVFKTIVSGLDPDSRRPVAQAVRESVPGFRPTDERGLFAAAPGEVRARFWFYPDRIRTVTDGRIGVVSSHRFTADLERIDGKPGPFRAGRDAVDHLNANYDAYARAFPPLRELRTVGRMMGVAKWLEGVKARRRIDLDALLAVELSPYRTPERTRKLLAATRGVRAPGDGGGGHRVEVYCLDALLDNAAADTAESRLLDEGTMRVAHLAAPPPRAGSPAAAAPWSIVTSLSGGIELNPAKIAPPRKSPASPLIARIRAAAEKPNAAGAGGIFRSTLRGLPPVPRGGSARPAARSAETAPPAARPVPPRGGGKPRDTGSKAFSWKTPAYPAEIVATGEARAGGTIVLKRGRATAAPPGAGR